MTKLQQTSAEYKTALGHYLTIEYNSDGEVSSVALQKRSGEIIFSGEYFDLISILDAWEGYLQEIEYEKKDLLREELEDDARMDALYESEEE